MLLILSVLCLAFKAHASSISLHGTTTVAHGGEANFNCMLANPTGVLQVTWQRGVRPESLENMATYNKPVGEQINEPFKGKVILSNSSLSSSSITLKNVTWADENCYVCSFNVYPDGSKRKQICLKVEGISEMHKKNSSTSSSDHKGRKEELSCSATGKPAPKISWHISNLASTNTSSTVMNIDGTFTTSSNLTVEMPTDWRGQVYCVVNQGLPGQRQEEFNFSSQEKEQEEGNVSHKSLMVAVVAIIICLTVGSVLLFVKRLKRRLKRGGDFTAV